MRGVLVGSNSRGRPLGRWKDRVKEYMCETVGPNSRGRSLGRWKDRVKEYMGERGATRRGRFQQRRKECLDRQKYLSK